MIRVVADADTRAGGVDGKAAPAAVGESERQLPPSAALRVRRVPHAHVCPAVAALHYALT